MAELPLIGEIDKLSFADERIIHQVSGVVHGGCASCSGVTMDRCKCVFLEYQHIGHHQTPEHP